MNLAEIRKKSQREKEGGHPAAAAFTTPSKYQERPDVVAVNDQDPEQGEGEPLRHELVPFRGIETASVSFDPIALLLAGRKAAWASEQSQTVAEVEEVHYRDVDKYLCFRVAEEQYALNLMDIKEIIKPREITEVPGGPPFVKGIISLRGMIIPIFDMRMRLGFPSATSTAARFVVVKKTDGDGLCGLLVDQVYQVVSLSEQPIEKPPAVLEGMDREFVSGIGRHEERIYILMDLEKVLDINLL